MDVVGNRNCAESKSHRAHVVSKESSIREQQEVQLAEYDILSLPGTAAVLDKVVPGIDSDTAASGRTVTALVKSRST
jgi:hypothetical protein